jgi:arylsulfatase A-like enzyme
LRTASQPNIVYILADDLGYGDVQCLNPRRGKIPTPNIDRLASQGMTFTDVHSGSAVCTPTRYGILTGRYAWRTKLPKWTLGPYGEPLIPENRLTVPALLRTHGYHSACIGKWHLGWNWPREGARVLFDKAITGGPTAVGFDYYFGTDVPNFPPYCFIENDRTVGLPSVEKPKEMFGLPGPMLPGWRLDRILPTLTQRAVDYIGRRAADQEPFFLYFPLTSPHTPLAVTDEWRGKSGLGLYGDWVKLIFNTMILEVLLDQ